MLRPSPTRLSGDILMELDPEEWCQIDLRATGVFEPRTTALFAKLLRPGDCVVDVGAHVGYHTLRARTLVGDKGRVLAIDPQPYNCHKILANAELNGFSNIAVLAAAVGASDTFVTLKQQFRSDRSRLTLRGPGVNDGALDFIVPMVTLNWVLANWNISRLALLKIDVEGYELDVLLGADKVLGAIDNIIIEILPGEDPARARQVAEHLRKAGFRLFDVEGEAWSPGQHAVENNVWARRI
jgi:FkbM family methyltransferase